MKTKQMPRVGESHINFFKPCLAPNFGAGVIPDWKVLLKDPKNWLISVKYDGVRAEIFSDNRVLSRELKVTKSKRIQQMGEDFRNKNPLFRGTVEAEIWAEGFTRGEIIHFTSTVDVESDHTRDKYHKLWTKTGGDPEKGWPFPGRDMAFCTTWPSTLKFYVFDAWFYNDPALNKEERYRKLVEKNSPIKFTDDFRIIPHNVLESLEDIIGLYDQVIEDGGEGLFIARRKAPYKLGRFTVPQDMMYKMKDDNREYEGTIQGVYETTVAKEGTEKTVNPLGRSKTSQKKEDREASGMAGGFEIRMDDGRELRVGLKGYDHDQRRTLLKSKGKVVGQRISFVGMKPTKVGGVPSQSFYIKKQ